MTRWRLPPLRWTLAAAFALMAVESTTAFYLPGMTPSTYSQGDAVPVHVNNLTPGHSDRDNQVRSVFSYSYYKPEFHFCQPEGGPVEQPGSLGSVLFGDRVLSSPIELRMGENETCKASGCGMQTFSASDAKFVNERIVQDYEVNWYIDGLPAGQIMREGSTGKMLEFPGFPLGNVTKEGGPLLNNHLDVYVDYHEVRTGQYRVVGALVVPESLSDSSISDDGGKVTCGKKKQSLVLSEDGDTSVAFTYSVYWRPSDVSFATRWDRYLHVYSPQIHWISIANSLVIIAVIVGMAFTSLFRSLRYDISHYNRLDEFAMDDFSADNGFVLGEDNYEEFGWKRIHGDVFRKPRHALILSVFVGNGCQLLVMAMLTIAFAMLGFLSPSNRGSLATVMVLLHVFLSSLGGFVSTKMFHFFYGTNIQPNLHGSAFKMNFLLTPLLLPGIVFGTMFLMNMLVWIRDASGAVPFGTMLVLAGLWIALSVPLSFAGSYYALKQPLAETPTKTNRIPRQIPVRGRGRCGGRAFNVLFLGLLPFAAIFVELFFILNSIWASKFYYMFGFLFLCFVMMILTCITVSVLYVYSILCAEDYRWQWISFLTPGATALYVFLYAIIYWMRALTFSSFTGVLLYLGYSLLISFLTFVLTGSVGFISAYFFVRRIYRTIRVD